MPINNHLDDLPVGNVDYLKKLVEDYKRYREIKNLELFFSMALLPFYDAMWDGLTSDAGHLMYRLSDFLSEDKRRCMSIYPSSNGSLSIDGSIWDSLEDWRKMWAKYNPYIPELKKILKLEYVILQ